MTFTENSINDQTNNREIEDEIDFKSFLGSIIRNKKLIIIYSFTGLLLSTLIAFNTKKVWQGEFQIVLDSSNKGSPSAPVSPQIAKLTGLTSKVDLLRTEVGILKSPSVLMNIFEYVKGEKSSKDSTGFKTLRFKDWRNKFLDIELEKYTSILNISYRDHDKKIILPTLNKISTTYQDYSGKRRLRQMELADKYFKKQISLFKDRSIKSLQEAQQFAINQGLSVLKGEDEIDKEIPNSIDIEVIRVKAANQIRFIDQQLMQIRNLEDNSEQFIYMASKIPALEELSQGLKTIDQDLARFRVIYKDSDKRIRDLLKERSFVIDLMKRKAIGFLNAQKADAQARMKAAERPKGVLIKYRQLLNAAAKDKATLDELDSKYRELLLEKAQTQDPWQLITTPTLLPRPIAPRKKIIAASGLLAGFFMGIGASLISDKRKDIIYSIKQMQLVSQLTLLTDLPLNQMESWRESLDLVVSGALSEIKGNIGLFVVGNISNSTTSFLTKALKVLLENNEFRITKDLREARNYSSLIIISQLGITKRDELMKAKSNILFQNKPIIGLIVIKN